MAEAEGLLELIKLYENDGQIDSWQARGPRKSEYVLWINREPPPAAFIQSQMTQAGYELQKGQFYGKAMYYFRLDYNVYRDSEPVLRIRAKRPTQEPLPGYQHGSKVKAEIQLRVSRSQPLARQALKDFMSALKSSEGLEASIRTKIAQKLEKKGPIDKFV